ncbi:hypothetical protein ZIOFF_001476 [Zingiber officinale]|uniref:Myosin motor domain-containing protein n=1 Tax=Zingiber officinale TaxID=94328 RepID=A0A8J5IJW2_ZINOF|nr:hypothetical protein ZIOFF_001476 [Zingiber officinale]
MQLCVVGQRYITDTDMDEMTAGFRTESEEPGTSRRYGLMCPVLLSSQTCALVGYAELRSATEDFNPTNILGEDGFGPMFKKPIGIISLLDKACMFPRLGKEKFAELDLIISHYAGKVTYQTEFFLDKNRDYIVVEHCNLLSSSRCSFVSGLFASLSEESSRSSYKFSSLASRFKVYLIYIL